MKNYLISENVKEKILEGINKASTMISKTFGPQGKNVIIDDYGLYLSSDGYTVCNSICLENPLENFGVKLLQNVANLTKKQCGDGTTSTIILGSEFCKNILKTKINDVRIVNTAIIDFEKDVLELLDKNKIEKIDEEKLRKVIYTSCNNKEIENIVFETIKEGLIEKNLYEIVNYKPTLRKKLYYEKYEGMFLERGIISTYFSKNGKIVLENPYVIIVNDDIKTINEIENIIYDIKDGHKDIFIIANYFSKEVVDYLLFLSKSQKYNIGIVLTPEYSLNRNEILEDIAIYLNTFIVTNKTLYLTMETIGKADYVEITKDYTIIKKNNQKNEKLEKRISYLKDNVDGNDLIKNRLASLTKKVKTIYIPLEKEYDYELIKEKVMNAVNSGIRAINYGISKGKGNAFLEIQEKLENKSEVYNSLKDSLKIISKTLENKVYDEFEPLDATANLKDILSNSLHLVRLFMSIDGYVKRSEKESSNIDVF